MQDDWVKYCLKAARRKADFYSGARKILRPQTVTFDTIKDDLRMEHAGYTKSKMNMLIKNYFHEESRNVARMLWEKRLTQDKYGSVGFTCYNHFIKGDVKGATPRGSVFGPCIQSVTLTYLKRDRHAVDVFYRTTELFKKFPADLVFLRDVLLKDFPLKIEEMTFHFANVTCHPMYFVTLLPLIDDPIAELERIKKADEYFYNWIVKWTARYICPEHHRGIAKFAQAMRVHKDANERIPKKTLKELQKYLRDNHPGYRNEYQEPEEEEDE